MSEVLSAVLCCAREAAARAREAVARGAMRRRRHCRFAPIYLDAPCFTGHFTLRYRLLSDMPLIIYICRTRAILSQARASVAFYVFAC